MKAPRTAWPGFGRFVFCLLFLCALISALYLARGAWHERTAAERLNPFRELDHGHGAQTAG
jgi:hypothetical protein